jgi:hypothetical protein
MQCSYCGTPLSAGTPFCPNCGRPTSLTNPANPANPTPYNAPQQAAPNTSNEAAPYMHFGSPQETSWVSPDVAPPSSPVQPYQPQQPLSNQQPHMIFGAAMPQEYPQPGGPPQQQPYQTGPQYPQQSPPAFAPGPGYPQAGPPPQPGTFVPGQFYGDPGGPVPPLQHQSGTFGQEQPYPAMNMPQQQGMYPQGYFAQPASTPQQRQRRSGLSKGIIVLLIVLVIAIIGAGGILLYATVLLPASRHAQTNTVSTTQSKTPTVQATTAITTTNPQDLYTQVMSRKPTLNDPLTAQDANNWQDFSTLQGCTFSGSALHLHGSAGNCIGESTSFTNFAYQVKVNIIQGNVGGIAFRFDAINRKFYFFAINPDGVYAIVYIGGSSGANNEKLLASATSTAITTGLNQPNTLTVIARGSNINIYINKHYVTTLTDSSSTNGAIGMLGGNSASSTSDVAFSDAQVWTL